MPGIPREFAEHTLNVFLDANPVKQSIRRLSEPRAEAIGVEVNRLLNANFIMEIKESEWLANTVMVPKKDGHPADVRGLHIAEQALPEGSLPSSSDRLDH